ncbi:MAG: hypothetical protein ACHQ6T_12385 [Myxococcota bacterium]
MLSRALGLAFCVLAATGCANHVRFDEEVREHETRDVTRASARIEARDAVVAQPFVELSIEADELVQIRRRETLVRLDEETPWRAQNELWEVPTGLVAVPAFLALRASNKLLLGLIPDDVISSGTDFAFAALNPALNVESETRVRGREVSRRSRDLDTSEEQHRRPLAQTPVVFSLAQSPSQHAITDSAGHVRVELLSLLTDVPASPPHLLHIEVAGDGVRKTAVLELQLSRQIAARVVRAAQARAAARAPGASAESAAQALVALDALGFPQSALALERELREHRAADGAWLARLNLALEDD